MPVPPTALLGGFVAIFSDSSGRLYAKLLTAGNLLALLLGSGRDILRISGTIPVPTGLFLSTCLLARIIRHRFPPFVFDFGTSADSIPSADGQKPVSPSLRLISAAIKWA